MSVLKGGVLADTLKKFQHVECYSPEKFIVFLTKGEGCLIVL